MGKNKFAVITGASSGIGLELAKLCTSNGFDIMIVADSEKIFTAASELQSSGHRVWPVQANLAQEEGVRKLHSQIRDLGRPLDALLLNAGVGVNGRFDQISLEDDLNLINLNITSIVHLAKLEIPEMIKRGEGKVLMTASIAALMPGPYYATYAASKSFVLSFAEALQYELKGKGVTVTALMPGPTETNFFERAGMEDTPAGKAEKDDPAQVAEQGFRAMMKGQDHVIAGSFQNKVQGFLSRFLSEQQRAGIHAAQIKPESAA